SWAKSTKRKSRWARSACWSASIRMYRSRKATPSASIWIPPTACCCRRKGLPEMNQTRTPLTWSLIIVVGFLTLCPVLMLLLGSFSQGLTAFGNFTTAKYVAAYTDPFLLEVTVNTVIFVLGSSLFSTVLAVFLAYLNTRTNMPMKGLFTVLSIVPMMIPHLLSSVSWALLLNPSNGLLNMMLQNTFGLQEPPLDIYSLWGMILVEGLLNMP